MAESDRKRHYLMFDFRDGPAAAAAPMEHAVSALRSLRGMDWVGEDKTQRSVSPWELILECPDPKCLVETNQSNIRLHRIYLDQDHVNTLRSACEDQNHPLRRFGIDLPLHRSDYWNPAEATWPLFKNRTGAHNLIGLPTSPEPSRDVNVVIVDQGVDRRIIEQNGVFGGGWKSARSAKPGDTPGGHGSMLARNVLAIAPGATIFDLPLIPADIVNIPVFLSEAQSAFQQMHASISLLRESLDPRWQRPWVILNAWATLNSGGERKATKAVTHPSNYTRNLEHPFNHLIGAIAEDHDVIFAAGNCGQFCPAARCGVDDIGPGRSILGANSHPNVLTAGAVRVDGLWLGYSSQGPGALAHDKPDLCAPSQFAEDNDEFAANTGTSAASAVVAGVVARLRSKIGTSLKPSELKTALIKNPARRCALPDRQLGHGIIHAGKALGAVQ